MTIEELYDFYCNDLKEINTTGLDVSLVEPEIIKFQEDVKLIGGELYRKIYSNLGISRSVNNKVFNTDTEIWRAFIRKVQGDKLEDFSISNQTYLYLDNKDIAISIVSEGTKSRILSFIDSMKKYDCKIIGGESSHIIHISYNDCVYSKDYLSMFPYIIVKIDHVNGIFKYDVLYKIVDHSDNSIVIVGIEKNQRKSDLLTLLSCTIDNEIQFLSKMAERSFGYVKYVMNNTEKISVRELTDTIKRLGCKFILKEDGNLERVSELVDSSGVVNMINSFNTPFKSLNKMSLLRKSLKRDSMTSVDLLKIISANRTLPCFSDPGLVISNFCNSIGNRVLDGDVVRDEL